MVKVVFVTTYAIHFKSGLSAMDKKFVICIVI